MKMETFSLPIANGFLHGITHLPDKPLDQVIVFLHGWGGYRTGPHDMFVKFSESFARMGFHCIRFDFRGKGYSGIHPADTSTGTMLEDLDAVLGHVVSQYPQGKITLCGICSGAKLGIYYALKGKHPIRSLIELSSVPLRMEEGTREVAAKSFLQKLKCYSAKLFQGETWRKVCKKEIHPKYILRNICSPLRDLLRVPLPGSGDKRKNRARPTDKRLHFTERALLIHAEKDPETGLASRQVVELMRDYNIDHDVHIIPGANHSFYSIQWEEMLESIIGNWLMAQLTD